MLATIRARTNLWRHLARLRRTRLWPRFRLRKRLDGITFEVDVEPDPTGIMMYLGLYEPVTVRTMRRFLTAGDTFIDVGANVGYLSALGAAMVGPGGQVHSFEPVPRYFARLRRLAELNPGYTIVPTWAALGIEQGTAVVRTSLTSIGANTVVPGYNVDDETADTAEVPMMRLDRYISETGLTRIALIKIDTEGYEFPILEGLEGFLQRTDAPPPLLVEVHPTAYPYLGRTLSGLALYTQRYGYRPYRPDGIGGDAVDLTRLAGVTTVVFLTGRTSR